MSVFEFLFNYKPIIYRKGKLAFLLLGSKWWFIPVLVLAVVGAYFFYRMAARDKWTPGMVALRAVTFALLAFMFLRPVLNVSTVLPQESYFAVVIDNSASMTIKDDGLRARADELKEQLEKTSFLKRLAEKFKIRIYRFDKDAERIEQVERMTWDGKRTRLEAVTELLREELGTVPLTGVALITDGADNSSQQFTQSLARLESKPIPFYTVGVGSDEITSDAELIKIAAPRELLKASTAVIGVSYRSHGFAGKKATITVRENGTFAKKEDIVLPADGEIAEKSLDVPVKTEGARIFSFTLEIAGDRIAENNVLDALISVRNDQPQILYVEGEPRWEYKFIGRSMEDDSNIRLVRLLRSSPNKFYRQGIDNESVLADGFPKKKEELYAYKGIILGSIESTFFSQDQLNMILEYVDKRGGGFMMLGGRNSFAGGHYENSPIAPMIPVQLGADRTLISEKLRMLVTDFGRGNALMRLNADANANIKQWSDLPPLGDFVRAMNAKAGALVLAKGQPETGNESPILMAYQRYGTGRSMAFMSSNTWAWQMGMDSKDMTHETFWRQVMRWLVNGSPDQVTALSDKDTYLSGESVSIDAQVADKSFNRLNNARVVAKVTDPSGKTESVSMDWSGEQDGAYHTQINAGSEGLYQLQVDATLGAESLGGYRSYFRVHDRPVEYYNARLDAGALKAIADQTGGHYYPLSRMGDIPDDAVYVEGESSFVEQKELWDLPILFILLCAALGVEWFWRKKRGLA